MECPSLDRIASGAMTDDERGAWLDHASGCETCRAIVITMPGEVREAAPVTVGRFVLGRELGRGAMGVVYSADDPELGRPIAIKVLHDEAAGERLHREARALARLAHDNVVRVYDVGVDNGRTFVAMELVEGVTLRQWLKNERTFDEILATLLLAGRGLVAAHAAGIVHRDFKPDNVMVGGGRVVVGDFGLSRVGASNAGEVAEHVLDSDAEAQLTRTGAAVGTPAYMAPEQATGEATASSDQFAFCATAWEALFGVRPFHGTTLRELREASLRGYFTRPAKRTVPRRVERALRRGLAATPAERFGSMTELLDTLAPRRRTRWIVAAAGAIAVTGVLTYALVDRAAPDPCITAGESIFESWDDTARRRVRTTRGDEVFKALDDYAAAWRDARTAACRRDADVVARRAARDICYERARAAFAHQVASPPLQASELRALLLPTETCDEDSPLPKTPGSEVDVRGCGCPYSACGDDRVCVSECNGRAFRYAGKVLGITDPHDQDAVLGATADGTTLLYLASSRYCGLDRLKLARLRGDRYESIDLTPQLVSRGLVAFEGCCTLAADGRSLLVARLRVPGLLRFGLDGDTLFDRGASEFAAVVRYAGDSDRLSSIVLSHDELDLYFNIVEKPSSDPRRNGPNHARRASRDEPFATPTRLSGRASTYEYVTGVSTDNLTLFMATEYSTSVLVRMRREDPFGDLGEGKPPSRLPGWRAFPIDGCRRIITTMSPGGCQSEDSVILEAVGR